MANSPLPKFTKNILKVEKLATNFIILSPLLGVEPPILDVVTKRRGYGFETIDDKMIAEQQEIADTFYELKLIPKKISVKEVVWQDKS